jgi:hypothetical protein
MVELEDRLIFYQKRNKMPDYTACPTCGKDMEIEWGNTFNTECYNCDEKTWERHRKEFEEYEALSWWKKLFTETPQMYYVLKVIKETRDE